MSQTIEYSYFVSIAEVMGCGIGNYPSDHIFSNDIE